MHAMIETDALVIGAGPVGLFQVFQLGLLDIRCHVVDSLPQPGGQCVALYADKPIYDIPAIAVCTGQELADRLMRQIEPFAPVFHLGQEVASVDAQADGRFMVGTTAGQRFLARTVVIAGGVGAFQARRLKLQGIERYEGTQLLYRLPDAAALAGQSVVVTGQGDDALEAANALAEAATDTAAAGKVTLLHRRDVFQASDANIARMRALCEAGRLQLAIGQPTGITENGGRLSGLEITHPDGSLSVSTLDTVLAFLGVSPRLGPIADWGLQLERKQLQVDVERFSTSTRGIFAVGDIVTYPGKKKLIVSGFAECVQAAFGAAELVFPGKPQPLQYTTTSTRLHQLLGVP